MGILLAVACAFRFSSAGSEQQPDAKAILERVHEAIGGKQNLLEIRTLLVQWTSEGVTLDRSKGLRREVELRLLLPDHYRRIDSVNIANWPPVKLDTLLAVNRVFIDGEPQEDSQIEAYWFAMARHQLTFLMHVRTKPDDVIEVYRGRSEVHGEAADVIDFLRKDGYLLGRVYISSERGLPLMVAYGDEAPNEGLDTVVPRVQGEPVQLVLGEYKPVDNVLFPSRITVWRGGNVEEELYLTKYVVNARVGEVDFEVR